MPTNELKMTLSYNGENMIVDSIEYEGTTIYEKDTNNPVIVGGSDYEFEIDLFTITGSNPPIQKHKIEISQTHSNYTIK